MRRFMVRLTLASLVVIGGAVAIPQAANAADQDKFINTAGKSAKPSQDEYGVPASVTVAQAILESGWGESDLASDAKNYFGMKCHDKKPGSIATDCTKVSTRECDDDDCWTTKAYFRVYDSMADSYRDHGQYLRDNSRYATAFDHTDDADKFIHEIADAGYATDPKYASKIISLMDDHDLYRFN